MWLDENEDTFDSLFWLLEIKHNTNLLICNLQDWV